MLNRLTRVSGMVRITRDPDADAAAWERLGFIVTPACDMGCLQSRSVLFGANHPVGVHFLSVTQGAALPTGLAGLADMQDGTWAVALQSGSMQRTAKKLRAQRIADRQPESLTARWHLPQSGACTATFAILLPRDSLPVRWIVWDLEWPAPLCEPHWLGHRNGIALPACCTIVSAHPVQDGFALNRLWGGALNETFDDSYRLIVSEHAGLDIRIEPEGREGHPLACRPGTVPRIAGLEIDPGAIDAVASMLAGSGAPHERPTASDIVAPVDPSGFAVHFADRMGKTFEALNQIRRMRALEQI